MESLRQGYYRNGALALLQEVPAGGPNPLAVCHSKEGGVAVAGRRVASNRRTAGSVWGFLGRFTATHVVTYLVFGVLFMIVSQYFRHFAADPLCRR